jgi:hypothetical protein
MKLIIVIYRKVVWKKGQIFLAIMIVINNNRQIKNKKKIQLVQMEVHEKILIFLKIQQFKYCKYLITYS